VSSVLDVRSQASIGEVLREFPASQGLGSVLGLLALGARHGIVAETGENVAWIGGDGISRQARIPLIYFLKEKLSDVRAGT